MNGQGCVKTQKTNGGDGFKQRLQEGGRMPRQANPAGALTDERKYAAEQPRKLLLFGQRNQNDETSATTLGIANAHRPPERSNGMFDDSKA